NPVVAGAVAAVLLALVAGGTFGYLKYRETKAALARESLRVVERDDALGKRDTALSEAKKANDDLNKANDQLTHRLGVSAMVLANAAYDRRDVVLGGERLDQGAVEQRGWEWRYLKRQLSGGIFTLYGHRGEVAGVAFSPDGTRIVTVAGDSQEPYEAKVWDARTGMLLFDVKGVGPPWRFANIGFISVAFSADSKRILAAGSGQSARVYDATTGALQLELEEDAQLLQCAAFSPDGTRIVTGSNGRTPAKVWDASTGKALGE